jgi:hypothetical protein
VTILSDAWDVGSARTRPCTLGAINLCEECVQHLRNILVISDKAHIDIVLLTSKMIDSIDMHQCLLIA